jgi:siroheme synthase-like protein
VAHEARLYPVSLVVAGRPCLVVGGGPVGARKAEGLLACGAEVTLVAPELSAAVAALEGTAGGALRVEARPYRSPEASAYRLVVTATGVPDVDHRVFLDAEAAGVWVNSADDLDNCAFLLPAVHRDGPVTVAVSTAGASPALAQWLRTRVAEAIGPEVGVLAGLLDEARAAVKASGRSTEDLDWPVALEAVVPLVREGRVDEARDALAAFAGI